MVGEYLYSLELIVKEELGLKNGVVALPFNANQHEDYEVKSVNVYIKVSRAKVWKRTKRGAVRFWIKGIEGSRLSFESRSYIGEEEVDVLKNWKRVFCKKERVGEFKNKIIERYKEVVEDEYRVWKMKKESVDVFCNQLKE